jgi:hypothetical protein
VLTVCQPPGAVLRAADGAPPPLAADGARCRERPAHEPAHKKLGSCKQAEAPH